MPDATLHQFRHYYGTSLRRSGVDLRVVQELMGHENLTSTQIYTLVDDQDMRAGIDKAAARRRRIGQRKGRVSGRQHTTVAKLAS
jgi:integrase/recombinase XerD